MHHFSPLDQVYKKSDSVTLFRTEKNVNHSLKPKPQVLWLKRSSQDTVPFHSIRQSRVTGPQKSTKCHDGHGHFGEVMKSFLDSKN